MKTLLRSISLLMVLAIFSLNGRAQHAEPAPSANLDKLLKIELGLHGVGLSCELPLNYRWVIDLSTGLGGGYYVSKTDVSRFNSSFIINDPVAYFKSEFKYYYSRSKRLSKRKQIRNNTGNYIAFQSKYTTRRVFNDNDWDRIYSPLNRTLLNEIHWGIQRPMGQKFLFNFHVGLGYASDFDFKSSWTYPALGVKFAYILAKH